MARGPVLTAQLATFAAAFTLTVARILFGLLRAERKLRTRVSGCGLKFCRSFFNGVLQGSR